jgi:hypothetical protein
VVYTAPYRKTLRIRKEAWRQCFDAFEGVTLRPGDEIVLAPAEEGGSRIPLPAWAIEQLDLGSGDNVCITQRDGRFALKKLALVQEATPVPGCTVIDTFADRLVTRSYGHHPDLDDIQLSTLQGWLSGMGRLRYDPLPPFEEMAGHLGLLARKGFLGGWTAADREAARALSAQIAAAQDPEGSWEGDVLLTAANLIRLRQLELSPDAPASAEAAEWLLARPEPAGLPGLYLVSDELTERFNAWKCRPGAKGRPHRRESKGEFARFVDGVGYPINYAMDACELRLTWTTALVLEALLRCGLHQAPRVVRALNTLFALSGDGGGGWCGCGYLDAQVDVPVSAAPVDLNRFTVPSSNVPHAIDWFLEPNDILRPTYDGGHRWLQVDERRALRVKSWHNTGLCTMVMNRALSHHPGYAGSTLEEIGTLRLAYCQSAYGTWGETVYLSSMLGFLARSTHLLAAFLVLRSVPRLIRAQRPDGLWHEAPLAHSDKAFPPLTAEGSTFMILSALQRFGFLELLLPGQASADSRPRSA